MRPKIILGALAVALGMLLPAIYFHFKPIEQPVAQPVASADSVSVTPARAPTILNRVRGGPHDGVSVDDGSVSDSQPQDPEELATKREVELYELGRSHDAAALPKVLIELHNANAEVRSAALTATMDIGSRDAIPALQQEMNWTEDLHEKLEIQKAIDFLKLPEFALDENGSLPQNTQNESDH